MLLLLGIVLPRCTSGQELTLTLRLDSDLYLESQEIWAHVTITNQGSKNEKLQLRVMTESGDGVRFKLSNQIGKVTEYRFRSHIDYSNESPLVVGPKDSLTADFEILSLLADKRLSRSDYLSSMVYLTEGSYRLQAKTRPFSFPQKDTLVSNVVQFRVTKPTGNELRALKLLRNADQTYLDQLQKNEHAIAMVYEKFLTAFPKSKYAPYAYRQLTFLYSYHPLRNDEKLKTFVTKLADDFPNNNRAVRELSKYTADLSEKGNKRDVLEKLAREHPDSKVGKFSKKKLLELQK